MHRAYFAMLLLLCSLGIAVAQEMPRYPNVRIMVVIPEKDYEKFIFPFFWQPLDLYVDRTFPTNAAEEEITKAFTEAGYVVVDQQQYAAQRYSSEFAEAMKDPTGLKARQLTSIYGADILVIGQAFSEKGRKIGDTTTARARVEARAVVTRGTPQIIGVDGRNGGGADPSRIIAGKVALESTARLVAPYLVNRVAEAVGGPKAKEQEALGPQPTRVAILPFDFRAQYGRTPPWLEAALPDLLAAELYKAAQFDLVDRTHTDRIIAEQGFNLSGLVSNPGEVRSLGTLAAADYLMFCRVTEFAEKTVRRDTGDWGIKYPISFDETRAIVNVHATFVNATNGIRVGDADCRGEAVGLQMRTSRDWGWLEGEADKSAAGRACREAIAKVVQASLRSIPLMSRCPHCNAQLVAQAKFCQKCGCRLDVADLNCTGCGKRLPVGANFCPYCGAPRKAPSGDGSPRPTR